MDNLRPQRVSVTDPIGLAIEQVKLMLFKPFDFPKWFAVGFCAWLAYLGQSGGMPSFNFNTGDHNNVEGLSEIKEAMVVYLPIILIAVAIAVPIFIIIGVVFCWLRSRGQFMFVHCVAGNKSEVVVPWKKFARHGNSVFLFRIVVGLIGVVVIGFPIAFAVLALIALESRGLTAAGLAGLCAAAFFAVFASVLVTLVSKFTNDFVVPIMLLKTESCMAGWKQLLAIIKCNKARMAGYILFQILISIVIGFISTTICLVGCCLCCSSVLLVVPYVGTVILLPLIAFRRAYSLFYLRQFGVQFDVFSGQAA